MLRLLGAELELTPGRARHGGRHRPRRASWSPRRPARWMPQQFDNPANPAIHAATTAEEIWADTGGEVDAVVAGVGTGGTLTGIARVLKAAPPGVRIIARGAGGDSPVLSGGEPGPHDIQGIGAGFVPAVLDCERARRGGARVRARGLRRWPAAAPRRRGCRSASPRAPRCTRRSAWRATRSWRGGLVVGIAPSFAERYLSTELFAGL